MIKREGDQIRIEINLWYVALALAMAVILTLVLR